MAQTVTYNQLVTMFNDIADNHFQINEFGEGMIDNINSFEPNNGEFPILWVVPQPVEITENSLLYKVRILVFDIDDTDDSYDREILSDTLLILNDVIKSIKNNNEDYYVVGRINAIPFNQRFVNYCTGWYADVTIETNLDNNPCDIPSA